MVAAGGSDVLCSNSNWVALASAERDDAPHRIVRRDANRHAIAWNNFDAEAAHTAAELREHFVACVALDPVEPAAVHRYHRSLHVDEIVLAQIAKVPFIDNLIIW